MREEPWFTKGAKDDDVAISSSLTLSRNLRNYPFPLAAKKEEKDAVKNIIFNIFKQQEKFPFFTVEKNEIVGSSLSILQERGIMGEAPCDLILCGEGGVTARVNGTEHIKIRCFKTGMNFRECYNECREVEKMLGEKVQFAWNEKRGFLTSDLRLLGSAMKLSARFHLFSTLRSGLLGETEKKLSALSINIKPSFQREVVERNLSFFDISTTQAMKGSDFEQLASFEAACRSVLESERREREKEREEHSLEVKDLVIRYYALSRVALFLKCSEAFAIISAMKYALNASLAEGVEQRVLTSLLYRVRDAHAEYILATGNLVFEDEIMQNLSLKRDRVRALILQEALKNLVLKDG